MIPKFRAWDKNTNDMVRVKTIDLENDGSIGCIVDYSGINLDISECVLMQSTGLKDKNGVEIFEGDILQSEHYFKYQVVFKGDCWRCESLKNNRFKNRFIGRDLKVIGNIWEDGDLIDSE